MTVKCITITFKMLVYVTERT